jgi:hypothetical protein
MTVRRQRPNWHWIFLASILALGLSATGWISWQRMKVFEIAQRRADQPVGELLVSHTVSQSFYSPSDGLYQIDLPLGTYGHPVTSDLILHLTTSPDARDDLATVQVNGHEIENNAYHSFRFPRQRGIAGRTLYFNLEAPDASPGNAITPYRSNEDAYQHGQAYYDGVVASNDLAFAAHYRLGPLDAARFVLHRLSEQRPCLWGHPLFYVALIVVHYALVSKLFVFLQERKARPSTGEEIHS